MAGRMVVRQLATLAEPLATKTGGKYSVPGTTRYKKLMERQAIMTRDDGLLVWEKMPKDKIYYGGACVLATLGVGLSVFALVNLATPPKNG